MPGIVRVFIVLCRGLSKKISPLIAFKWKSYNSFIFITCVNNPARVQFPFHTTTTKMGVFHVSYLSPRSKRFTDSSLIISFLLKNSQQDLVTRQKQIRLCLLHIVVILMDMLQCSENYLLWYVLKVYVYDLLVCNNDVVPKKLTFRTIEKM